MKSKNLPQKESGIQRLIIEWLNYLQNQGKLMFFRMPTAGIWNKKSQGFIPSPHVGAPDIIIFIPIWDSDEKTHYQLIIGLEVKSKLGKQSEHQKRWQERLENIGGIYQIVKSLEEAKEFLRKWVMK